VSRSPSNFPGEVPAVSQSEGDLTVGFDDFDAPRGVPGSMAPGGGDKPGCIRLESAETDENRLGWSSGSVEHTLESSPIRVESLGTRDADGLSGKIR
jgi:hypothetical protein